MYKEVDYQANRRNYRQADNVNYLDGDRASNLGANDRWIDEESGSAEEEESEVEVEEEEEEGVEEGESNEQLSAEGTWTNKMYRRKPVDSKERPTSLVNNKVRVVKGGSWRDRAYYLQASTRRYYDQDKSSSWIGFRCAMDRLGSRVIK